MAELSHLLLFDSDPNGLDALTYGFEKDGYSTIGTGNPAKAKELIAAGSPKMLLVRIRENESAGLELIRATASNPGTRGLPCIGLGSTELRDKTLAAGAFSYVTTPLFLRDAINSCRLVAAAMSPGQSASRDAEITVKLADFHGLYYLIRALAVTSRSCAVELRQEKRKAELRLIDGTPAFAEIGTAHGLPAIYQLLLWRDADVRIRFHNVVQRSRQMSLSSSELIDDCEKFLRDFVHEVRDLGSAHTVYRPGGDAAPGPSPALPAEVAPVFRMVDGGRDLATILADSPFRIFDTLNVLKRLRDSGAISAVRETLPAVRSETTDGHAIGAAWFQRPAPSLGPELEQDPDKTPPPTARRATPLASAADARASAGAASLAGEVTPPPRAVGVAPVVTVGAGNITASKPASSVARGEIEIRQPKLLREAQSSTGPLAPSVIVDVVTPPPVIAPARSQASTPSSNEPSRVESSDASLPSAERGSPTSPSASGGGTSASAAPAPTPAAHNPHPAAHPSAAPGSDVGNGTGRGHPRASTPMSFDALESDFFAREADLYKGDAVETFDDLDRPSGAHGARRPGTPKKP